MKTEPGKGRGPERPRRPKDVFRDRLKELLPRGKAKVVAARSGVSPTTLSNWIRGHGRVNPELETLEKLAAAITHVSARTVTAADLISDVEADLAQPTVQYDDVRGQLLHVRERVDGAIAAIDARKPKRVDPDDGR